MNQIEEEKIIRVPLAELMPSPLNPRTTFDETKIAEMAKSVASKGVLNPLLTRPACAADAARGFGYEIIAGERRFRAAGLVKLETVPIIVREISDADALEMMLIENLQREDLNPIEEAEGIERMLALEVDGKPMHTVESVAAKIGRTTAHVGNTRRLTRVPKRFQGDVASGKLGRSLCYLALAIPDRKLMEQFFAEMAKGFGQGPWTFRQARDHRERNYMKELRGAPFDQASAELLPKREEHGERVFGGACADCPFNTANAKEEGEGSPYPMCMNPTCFTEKVQQNVKAAMAKAEAEGKKVVTGKEAEKLLDWDGNVASSSGKVQLKAKPAGETIAGKKVPTWGKMLKGEVQPQITVIIDKKGRVIEAADRNEAIEAAKSNGFKDLFGAGAKNSPKKSAADQKDAERRKKELLEGRIKSAVEVRVMAGLVSAVERDGIGDREWAALVETAMSHAGSDGRNWVIQRRQCPPVKHKESYYKDRPDPDATLKAYAKTLPPPQVRGFVIELLLSQGVKWQGVKHDGTAKLMHFFKIDDGKIAADVKAEMAAGKSKKPKVESGKAPGGIAVSETNPLDTKLLERARVAYAAGTKTVPGLQAKLKIGYQKAVALIDKIIEENGTPEKAAAMDISAGAITAGLKPRKAGKADKTKAPKAAKKTGMTPEARGKIVAAMKARWAKRKGGGKGGGKVAKGEEVKI